MSDRALERRQAQNPELELAKQSHLKVGELSIFLCRLEPKDDLIRDENGVAD
jgi:hypothetical protein